MMISIRDIDCGFVDLAILWRPEVRQYRAQTHVSRVHCLPTQTEFTATVTRTHTGKHAIRLANNTEQHYLKVGHLKPPEGSE